MPKRKKLASQDDPNDSSTVKKSKKCSSIESCKEIIRALKNYNSEDERNLLTLINNAHKNLSNSAKDPSSIDDETDVNQPSSIHLNFDQIIDKVNAEQYVDVEQLSEDIEAIIQDVKDAYKEDEKEFEDANELYEFFLDVKQDVCFQDSIEETSSNAADQEREFGSAESPATQSNSNYEHEQANHSNLDELIQEVNEAVDSDGRNISAMFQILPPKSKFKDYYEMISNPIDMKTIEGKNRNNEYRNLNDLEKDLLLMVRNAKTYNKPGSQIYKDANTLRKLFIAKKIELEQRKILPLKSSDRIKAKRTSSSKFNKSFEDSPNASLNHEDSLVEDANDSGLEDEDDPMYKLYEFVRSYKNSNDVRLSDPFMRLPNRRYYPDYYDEIKRPTTLGKIKSKIKSNQYANLDEMLDELNIMFKNALKYNLKDSQIYRDALELQKQCFNKAKEYTEYVPVDDLSITSAEEDEPELEEEEEEEEQTQIKKAITSTPRSKKSIQRASSPISTSFETKKATSSTTSSSTVSKPASELDILLRKRFKLLFKTLLNYCDDSGRYPIDLFMEKPSRKDYPDYYVVIKDPIDMKTIDAKIKSDYYSCEDELLKDFKLMFDNCREYNEDGSQIYIDADNLEAALFNKINELDQTTSTTSKSKKLPKISKLNRSAYEKIKALFENVINYKDAYGRQLSKPFMKLPSKSDYPEYYEIIKKPIDLDKIGMKIKSGVYENLDDILSDLNLLFDNAFKFNEPDSWIAKDSMTLQNFAIQKKLDLVELGTDGIPEVKSLVQDLLTNLFVSVYGHIDEEGRCYSESLLEIIENNSKNDPQSSLTNKDDPTTFDEIKRCLLKNRYRRLDRFQSDMFAIFEKVRKTCRTDSQAFEDSIEMQQFFISLRNELCKNGERLQSPALNYTEADLNASVENLKQEKLPFEQDLDEKIDDKEQVNINPQITLSNESGDQKPLIQDLNEITFNDILFKINDYVYVEPKEKNLEPHIIHIQRIYKDENGEFNVYGCWFYRPNETFHLASKRFLEKEVFRSDNINSMPLRQVIGKCCVMFVKDYFKLKPKGFNERDVFVCESKYFTKIKQFKKIKLNWNLNPNFELEPRKEELTMVRVPSVFKDKQDRSSDDMDVDDEDYLTSSILDVQRVNVKCDPPEKMISAHELIYYEQYVTPTISIKQDDYVYVEEDEEDKVLIYKVGCIFVENGDAFVRGPLVVKHNDLDVSVKQAFYPQEVFLTSHVSSFLVEHIKSKCSVLSYKEYITKRPTEIAESDVYVCESKYCSKAKTLTKLAGGLTRRLLRNPNIVNDEYYGFRKPLQLIKKEVEIEKPSLLSTIKKCSSINFDITPSSPMSTSTLLPSSETENEESNDISISNFGNDSQHSLVVATPALKKAKVHRKIITGYILFASEVRKQVCIDNPDCGFGDISRIIGQEWKRLPVDTKQVYERKAQKQNEASKEQAKLQAEANAAAELQHGPRSPQTINEENYVYECRWEKCDFQCEEQQDLLDHLVQEPNGHIHKHYASFKDKDSAVYQCLIKGCSRVKKGGIPFPTMQRLVRHLREIHVYKQQPRQILPENRSRNFMPRNGTFTQNILFGSNVPTTNLVIQQPCQTQINQIQMFPSPNYTDSLNNSINTMNAFTTNLSPGSYVTTTLPHQQFHQQPVTQVVVQQQQPPPKPVEHLFVQPSRPNRLLYTDTYIKYIERLKPEQKHITNWEKQLNATQENTTHYDRNKLPTSWLKSEGNHGTVVNALWALRNYMFQDALNLSKLN